MSKGKQEVAGRNVPPPMLQDPSCRFGVKIMPDWTAVWTVEQAERELSAAHRAFVFSGPGWYYGKTDTMLVIPEGTEFPGGYVWAGKHWPKDQLFRFHVYSGSPADSFNRVLNAPSREDE